MRTLVTLSLLLNVHVTLTVTAAVGEGGFVVLPGSEVVVNALVVVVGSIVVFVVVVVGSMVILVVIVDWVTVVVVVGIEVSDEVSVDVERVTVIVDGPGSVPTLKHGSMSSNTMKILI